MPNVIKLFCSDNNLAGSKSFITLGSVPSIPYIQTTIEDSSELEDLTVRDFK